MSRLKGPTAHWHDDDGDEWVSPETAPDSYKDYWVQLNTIELINSQAAAAKERIIASGMTNSTRNACVVELKSLLTAAASRGDMDVVSLLLDEIVRISNN